MHCVNVSDTSSHDGEALIFSLNFLIMQIALKVKHFAFFVVNNEKIHTI